MSHLFQRPDSKYWWASYTGADGRRRRCSTGVELGKSKSRDEANAALAVLTSAAQKAKNGTLTEARIRKELSELLEDVTGQPLHFESAEQYLNNWLSNKEGAKSKGTAVKYKQVVNSFLKSLGKRRGFALAAMVPADAERWRDGLKKDKLTPNSVNQYVKILSGAFERARKLGYIPINCIRPANYISRVDKCCDIVGGCLTRSPSTPALVLPSGKQLPNRAPYCTGAVRTRIHAVGVNSAADLTPFSPGRVS